MQLLQLCWDEKDQNSLLFKFKREQDEINQIIKESVEKVQIKFELLKRSERSAQIIQEPFLISIKNLYFSANWFSIENLPSIPTKISIARHLIDDFVEKNQ